MPDLLEGAPRNPSADSIHAASRHLAVTSAIGYAAPLPVPRAPPMAQMTMVQAIQDALRVALREDPRVVVLGEDVGLNGGVFRVTEVLQAEFGAERVADTPLAENGIVGAAIGMALYGLRPIVEIQFVDFIY